MPREWKSRSFHEPVVQELATALGISPLLARLLAIRGITTPNGAKTFINPQEQPLHDPFLFTEMKPAVERIIEAAKRGERVMIHGDYDADGVTSTCVLIEALWDLGIEADYFLPNRLTEGYGMQMATVEEIAKEYPLLITVDCGTTNVKETARANELGMDVIITDHHDAGPERPPAIALINPVAPGEVYPNRYLSGAGVAWKLAQAIRQQADMLDDPLEGIETAVIGLVADVMPLIGENRTIVLKALERMPHCSRPGLLALFEASKLSPHGMTTRDIGFKLGPRLNAASRMDHPDSALKLLLSDDEDEALELAKNLNSLNAKRQNVVKTMMDEVCQRIEADGLHKRSDKLLVVSGNNWQRGVLGILAQKLTERYGKPVFLFAIEDDGLAHGSARAFGSASLIPLLNHARPEAVDCGGHEHAGGMKAEVHKLDTIESLLYEAAEKNWINIEPEPIWVDAHVPLERIDMDFINEMKMLEPYGNGNDEPVFYARAAINGYGARIVGNNHLRLSLEHQRGAINAIGFGLGNKLDVISAGHVEFVYQPGINSYQGTDEIQIKLIDIRAYVQMPAEVHSKPQSPVKPQSPIKPQPRSNPQPKSSLPKRDVTTFNYDRDSLLKMHNILKLHFDEMPQMPQNGLYLFIRAKQQKSDDKTFYQSITEEQLTNTVLIFSEIGLVKIDDGMIRWNTVAQKKQLSDSPTFCRLQNESAQVGAAT
jgi:single-stranded-DNA-specific exonuclease